MIYRLMLLFGAALLLACAPAMADFSMRIDNPRGHQSAAADTNYEEYYGYGAPDAIIEYGYDPRLVDPYGYPYSIGPYGPYPIVPSPPLVQAPTVVPPLIARPVTPHPRLLLRLRNGERIAIPHPRIRRLIPQYPDFLTSGSAYYPTPTYPLTPERRHRHHRHHRGR